MTRTRFPATMIVALVAFPLAAIPLAACAAPAVELPHGVTVSVFQTRFDYSLRQIEIKVSNHSDAAITVTRASLESTRFADPAVTDAAETVPAESARDLKVLLPDAVCGGADPKTSVVLDFTLPNGTNGRASLVPTDETGRIEAVNAQDCLGESVAEYATISGPEQVRWTPGAHSPAVLDIWVVPTGVQGELTVREATGTVLLALANEAGERITVQPIGLVIDADSSPGIIRILVVPNRCDPHAIAEDKRGTFFPLVVKTVNGLSGTIYIAVSDAVRGDLYDYYGDYCALPKAM